MTTNGTPQRTKKKGASVELTVNSQKTANPAQRKVKGMTKTSDMRNRMPCFGAPLQTRRSAPPSSALSICATSAVIDWFLFDRSRTIVRIRPGKIIASRRVETEHTMTILEDQSSHRKKLARMWGDR